MYAATMAALAAATLRRVTRLDPAAQQRRADAAQQRHQRAAARSRGER